jgi:hypothetical protein
MWRKSQVQQLERALPRIGYAEYILYMYNIELKIPKSCNTLNSLTNTNQRRLQRSP